MKIAAVIVAAGRGLRAGGPLPKQYRPLGGCPILAHSIRALAGHGEVARAVVVIHPNDAALYDAAVAPYLNGLNVTTCTGGKERGDSVLAGLAALENTGTEMVLIHDGARPLVAAALISRVIAATRKTGAAAPALPITDTLWQGTDGQVVGSIARHGLYSAQTPQGFWLAEILAAHKAAKTAATDDVQIALSAGIDVAIVAGDARNIKITAAEDFARASALIGGEMDIRTGNGFDVHAFEVGDHVTLCGVEILHDHGLKGHSDADVAMHALSDAIYGALAKGDIGRWFPPGDAKWENAASDIFLRHAATLAKDEGYAITNVDCTIICELPKIGPHADTMRACIAEILGVEVSRVSIKATTSERLGFTGRGEGIATIASATLLKQEPSL